MQQISLAAVVGGFELKTKRTRKRQFRAQAFVTWNEVAWFKMVAV